MNKMRIEELTGGLSFVQVVNGLGQEGRKKRTFSKLKLHFQSRSDRSD